MLVVRRRAGEGAGNCRFDVACIGSSFAMQQIGALCDKKAAAALSCPPAKRYVEVDTMDGNHGKFLRCLIGIAVQ